MYVNTIHIKFYLYYSRMSGVSFQSLFFANTFSGIKSIYYTAILLRIIKL